MWYYCGTSRLNYSMSLKSRSIVTFPAEYNILILFQIGNFAVGQSFISTWNVGKRIGGAGSCRDWELHLAPDLPGASPTLNIEYDQRSVNRNQFNRNSFFMSSDLCKLSTLLNWLGDMRLGWRDTGLGNVNINTDTNMRSSSLYPHLSNMSSTLRVLLQFTP